MYSARRQTKPIFILSCFAIFNLNLTNAQNSKFVLSELATEDDVNLLNPISAKEALPFVLFGTKESDELKRPFKLIEAEIKDGRLASGTKFKTETETSDPQMFLCQNQHDPQKCIAPKQFEKSQVLECEIEPKPTLEERPVKPGTQKRPCGSAGTGVQLLFEYKICKARHVSSNVAVHNVSNQMLISLLYGKVTDVKTNPIFIFSICYDKSTRRVLSAYHKITYAGMLSEKLLTRERQIQFEIDTENYDELVDETYYTNLKAEVQSKPQYKLRQMVPSEDMAFAWSIKPTHHFTNFALLHEDLMEPWNHINRLIRTHAENSLDKTLGVITGVIDIPESEISTPVDENQKNNIWVSIVAHATENSTSELAIMMNNFISKQSKNEGDAEGAETSTKPYIDKICGQDLCLESLKQVFNKVGGQVRCCPVTRNVINLFFPANMVNPPKEILHIRDLTTYS